MPVTPMKRQDGLKYAFEGSFSCSGVSCRASCLCSCSLPGKHGSHTTFSPAAGTYTSAQTVTISDSTSGATIYYTTNGSTPTTSSTRYTGAITVSSSETIKAIGTKSGYTQSAVGSAAYTINLTAAATPTFSPAAGTYTGAQTVTISDSTSGAKIYYTTNGSTPTTSSTQYTGAITVSSSETVKAIATATGYSQSAVGSAAYTINLTAAATPTFSPAAGTYTGAQTATISDSTSGATIYYTTNGSTPTTSSTQYTGAITVSSSETVKAIATATGYSQSAVGSAAYTINLTAAATPTFSPAAGTYTGAQTVTISDSTSGAKIYYTTNGTTPTTSSTQYTGAITVSSSETVKAIATATGYSQSAVGSAAYTITPIAASPTFSPGTGSYSTAQTVTISDSTPGAKIYYTTDGSTPTTSSTQYTAAITVNSTETINAIATATGYSPSPIGSAAYTITTPADPVPAFSPSTGTFLYDNAPTVSISDTDPSATLYYTTNGSTPTTSSSVYSGPISISATTTLKAIAADSGYLNSSVASAVYTIQADPPYLSLNGGSYVGSQSLTLSDDTGRSPKIYYTTNGTTPTTSSTLYSSPLTISSTETVEAIATSNGYQTSPVSSAMYTITSLPATPTFSLAAGSYTGPQLVTISTASQNATIYYTITLGSAGTPPTSYSTLYSGGSLTVGSTETLEAIAVVSGYPSSSTASATYTFPSQAPSSTSLTVSAGGIPVTSIAAGTTVTLTATAASGGSPITTGTVIFCDASAAYCTDIHLLGTAQLTSAGTATFALRPGIGNHSYRAVFVANSSYLTSASNPSQLSVAGSYPTSTTISATGSQDNYTLTATITGAGNNNIAPTGQASFVDASLSNSVLTSAVLSNPSSNVTLSATSTFTAGTQPGALVAGDFNGDGIPDVAVLDSGNGLDATVLIFLGEGAGTFAAVPGPPASVDGCTDSLVVGDFNGDGKLDIAAVGFIEACVAVLLGNGDGTFALAPNSPMSIAGAFSFVAGDFNEDGKLDLALSNIDDDSITMLLGNGDGTFTAGVSSSIGFGPQSIVSGDFNGDGKPDLIAWSNQGNSISILLNNGDGTFRIAPTSPIIFNSPPDAVAVGDFNGDGVPDLAIACTAGTVTVLFGRGDGAFTPASSGSPYYLNGVTNLTVGDFNGDGIADLAAGAYSGAEFTFIIDGSLSGNGSVQMPGFSGIYPNPVADLNGDGRPDWIQLNPNTNTVSAVLSSFTETATATASGVSPFGSGTHNVFASYAGDNNYAGSVSVTTPLTADTISPAPTPTFAPAPGTYTSSQVVSLGDNAPGAMIYYTTDGTTPTTNSAVFGGPFSVTPTETVQAVATAPGYVQSGVGIATYSLPPMAATPIFSPAAGTYANAQTVTISDSTSGATIYYTTDGSAPTTLSSVVGGPLTVSSTEALKAVATASGYSQSAIASANYTIGTPPSVTAISPLSGPVGSTLTITGTGFGVSQGTSSVSIGGILATASSWSTTQIQAAIPAGVGTGNENVVVTVNSLAANNEVVTITPLDFRSFARFRLSGNSSEN